MASLFFICPKTRHKAPTGIETDAKSLQAAWTGMMKVDCRTATRRTTFPCATPTSRSSRRRIPIGCIGSDDAAGSTAALRRIESRLHPAGREPRVTRRVGGSRHWQPYGHGSFGQAEGEGRAALAAGWSIFAASGRPSPPADRFWNGRRPVGIFLGVRAGKRRHHRGAERQRHGAGYDPGTASGRSTYSRYPAGGSASLVAATQQKVHSGRPPGAVVSI